MLNNVRTWYNGNLYDSKGEAGYARFLDLLKAQGKIVNWQRQVPFKVYADNKTYTVITDFLVTFQDRQEIHEFKKGYFSQEFIYKLGLWIKNYPFFTYLVTEEDGKGGYTYKTPEEFLDAQPDSQPQKHSKMAILFGKLIHKSGEFLYDHIEQKPKREA
jgi:hypothetical protein